jgi:hypothetical protein
VTIRLRLTKLDASLDPTFGFLMASLEAGNRLSASAVSGDTPHTHAK